VVGADSGESAENAWTICKFDFESGSVGLVMANVLVWSPGCGWVLATTLATCIELQVSLKMAVGVRPDGSDA
jgi:hypothetical protein